MKTNILKYLWSLLIVVGVSIQPLQAQSAPDPNPSVNPSNNWQQVGNNIRYSQGEVIIGGNDVSTPGKYLLYVENGILTEEVKAAVKNSAEWSDYVFDEDYELLPLKKVAAYIQEHQHLPNVPSAAEVVETGINVVKMDATLLRQIEELWLQTILLQEESKTLEQENAELQEMLEKLQALKENKK